MPKIDTLSPPPAEKKMPKKSRSEDEKGMRGHKIPLPDGITLGFTDFQVVLIDHTNTYTYYNTWPQALRDLHLMYTGKQKSIKTVEKLEAAYYKAADMVAEAAERILEAMSARPNCNSAAVHVSDEESGEGQENGEDGITASDGEAQEEEEVAGDGGAVCTGDDEPESVGAIQSPCECPDQIELLGR